MPLLYSALLIAPFLLFAAQAAYNLFFHPLRTYPGPLATRASKWPCLVRVAPNQLSYIKGEAWKDIYGHRTSNGRGNIPKHKEAYPPPAEALIRQYVGTLVHKLREMAADGNAIDMVAMLNYTTFDIMADLTFGRSLGMIESASYVPWVQSIVGAIKFAGILAPVKEAFPWLLPLLQRTFLRSMQEKRVAHGAFAVEHVNARLARETTRPDIWTFVLRNSAQSAAKGGLDLAEMHTMGLALMAAGTETTATLLSGLTWWLCRTPEKLARLAEEVRQTFHSEEDINMQALARLPFLNACIQEGLRMYPPVPVGLPRQVPPGGAVICGKPVATGTLVYVSHFAAYHNASNFFDPDSFHPERWLPDADARFANDKHNAFEPFNFGPRNCVGRNLAMHEIRAILANLVLHFDMQLSDRCDENWLDQGAWFVWDKKPLFVDMKQKAQ
ncbi:benzoate 4-monooxygenase cytochrome P450 [Macrophomina phaseolina]|uniref:Benzoate 4-monooxygenase cytochrome P450 n=1 Tax=Macrophomina phaseolina TaxID=35725 RepID=A0ABQ8GVC5_9PEZI|nr:benzoate 4-monooxygenase cytochrome P450 [Macrophomina phaseolina]